MGPRADHYPNNDPRAVRPGDPQWPRTTGAAVPEYRRPHSQASLPAVAGEINDRTEVTVGIHDSTHSGSAAVHFHPTATERISGRFGVSFRAAIRNGSGTRFPARPISAGMSADNVADVMTTAVPATHRNNLRSGYPKPALPSSPRISGGTFARSAGVFALSANTARTPGRTGADGYGGRWSQSTRPTGGAVEYAEQYRSTVTVARMDERYGPMSPICPQRLPCAPVRPVASTVGMPIGRECTQWPDTRVHIGARHIDRRQPSAGTRNRISFGNRLSRPATIPDGTYRSRRGPLPTATPVGTRTVVIVPATVVPATVAGTHVRATRTTTTIVTIIWALSRVVSTASPVGRIHQPCWK
jgi:hypothetical protein